MRTKVKTRKLLIVMMVVMAGLGMATLCPSAFSQGCALCYTQAASSGNRMIEALRSGILVLIVPPTLMWLVLVGILYAKRNQFRHSDTRVRCGSEW
jgi:hypothetical protein